ncbi:MAG: hypothetical protein JXQ83_04670, partial [Candidatus Glassbacteria bacterium]|nr:hypothetical protein [Candidatus Glassbacteria bacterium]
MPGRLQLPARENPRQQQKGLLLRSKPLFTLAGLSAYFYPELFIKLSPRFYNFKHRDKLKSKLNPRDM